MTFLFFGKERFLKDEALAGLKAKCFKSPSELDLNFQTFDAEEHGLSPVLNFLSTAPFLAEKRLAVLRNADLLSEEDGQRLAAAIDSLPSSAILVLDTEQTNTRKSAAVRLAAEIAQVTPCHTPFERELPGWVEARAKKTGITLERGASAHLVSRIGQDLALLDHALEETSLYAHPRKTVTRADIDAVTPSNPDEDVFRLTDLLLEGKKKEALGVVDGLFRSGSRAPEIVGALAGQLERYRRATAQLSAGRAPAEVAEELRVPRPFQNQFFQRLKSTSERRLREMQKELLRCDESFKTGRSEERLSVERFVLAI